MSSNYKLRDCIDAHDNDVRSLYTIASNNCILSASRDLSVRFWTEKNHKFEQQQQYFFHKNYILCVYYMMPNIQFPEGVILSAGYDNVIKGYFISSATEQFTLSCHTNAVTSITSDNNGSLISGSSDGTAISWDLVSFKAKETYKGHKHGIWSVVILDRLRKHFLTASADKEIYMWNISSANPVRKFIGHTDCVRGLLELPKTNQFLSCSNDCTIRLWCLNSGSCISAFNGHKAFIYSMARISDERFVSSGEDGQVCVWNVNSSTPIQSIALTAQSAWCVSALNNGDIVTGSSDGFIRIFSEHLDLQNGVEIVPKINTDDVTAMSLSRHSIEQLSLPGEYDKQLLKIHDEGNDILYEWSSSKDLWVKKRVLENKSISNDAKTHDYVFNIDIKDGQPPLKLNYNRGQDPWVVAKQFLDDNDLSPMFLDQVANFIMTNTNQQVPVSMDTQQQSYIDPFTGASRYVPTNDSDVEQNSKQFPVMSFFKYEQTKTQGLSKKIQEITMAKGLSEQIIKHIENIYKLTSDQLMDLCKWVLTEQVNWPDDQLFPLIDLLRILVCDSSCNTLCFANNEYLTKLMSRTILVNFSKGNTLTMVKLMVNAFLHQCGEQLMNVMFKQITECLHNIVNSTNDKLILMAVSSCLLNMSVSINIQREEYKRSELLDLCFTCLKIFEGQNFPEAVHRMLITIGTLVCNSDTFTLRDNLTMGVFEKINNFSNTFNDGTKWGKDVQICSQQLSQMMSSLSFINL